MFEFLNDSSTLQNKAFLHNFARISVETDRIFIKILPDMYVWMRQSL